ncbi:MAG TPA: MarR family transcriptional regulator [Paraburkholderia sp.]|jgi:DNA-binding MarR family transcriptional regulator|nr:MarR family transcriptional regulator [Paraburkholderia sp.]
MSKRPQKIDPETAAGIQHAELEDNVFFLCTQVVSRRNRAIQKTLRPIGLMPTEFRVLSAVLRKGDLTMLELAQWTSYERTRLTHILHGMEDRGWIVRTSAESDRRTVVVQATPSGAAIFRKAKPMVDELTDVIASGNTENEIEEMRRALRVMRAKLIEMDEQMRD